VHITYNMHTYLNTQRSIKMLLHDYLELLVTKGILVKDDNEYLEAADNRCLIEVNCPVEQTWVEMCSIFKHSDGNFYANLSIDSEYDSDDAMTLDDIRITKVLSILDIMAM
jgi:hypothetical protein